MNKRLNLLIIVVCFQLGMLAMHFQTQAQERRGPQPPATENAAQQKDKLPPAQPDVTTTGSVTVEGQRIDYQAVAGTIPLLDENEQDTTARMFYVAYFKQGVSDVSTRPLTFLYNGGPGSATIWLHMGAFGPRRVVIDSTIHMHGAPYELVNNDYSLLDATDLVFVDAPGTGFSRVMPGKEKDYYGVDQDGRAFSQFIMRFITKYGRWNSPKFLFGESYGTTRSAVLSSMLQNMYDIDLNGVILLSQILSFDNSIDGPSRNPGNDMPYILGLPTFAATAWYHHQLPQNHPDLEAFIREVENFATGAYAQALMKGATLDPNTFNQIAEQLHQYTGLDVDYIKKANLRVDGGEFEQQLLNKQGLTTGRLDTRFSGPSLDILSQRANYDPQSEAISGAYVSLFNDYVRKVLKYGQNMDYHPTIYGRMQWDWTHGGSRMGVNVMNDLATAMKKNPTLKVLLNAGYYDLATPFYEGVYELQHLPIPNDLQKNIAYAFYESGHMVYLHVPSLKQLHDRTKQFIESCYTPAH